MMGTHFNGFPELNLERFFPKYTGYYDNFNQTSVRKINITKSFIISIVVSTRYIIFL